MAACRVCWREGAPVPNSLCQECVDRALVELRAAERSKREGETLTLRLSESFKAQLRMLSMRGKR